MKTILHCIDTTGPGGAETVFIDLATSLPRGEYRAVVLIRGEGWVYEELRRCGIEPVILDAKGSFNWRYLRDLVALIRRERVDLVQSHLFGSNVYCSLAGLITRTPVIATFHGAVDIGDNANFKALKFGVINLGARAVIVVSEHLRQHIARSTQLKKEKISVIYNGIRTSAFRRERSAAVRTRFGWKPDDQIVGCLGNIRDAKGYDVLLEAVAQLTSGSKFRFVIGGQGEGKLYNQLMRLRSRLKLEQKVHFLGFVDDPAEFLSNLDLFLLPSTSEGFSIATIQAMAAGLPVIATRSGGPQEILTHADTGWMIEPGNAEAIVDAIRTIGSDDALKSRLAANGRAHVVRNFDLDAMLKAYRHRYDHV